MEWIQTLDYEHVLSDVANAMNMGTSSETSLKTSQPQLSKEPHSWMKEGFQNNPHPMKKQPEIPHCSQIHGPVNKQQFSILWPNNRMGKIPLRKKSNQPPKRSTRSPCKTRKALPP
jgi:hypothetical protein